MRRRAMLASLAAGTAGLAGCQLTGGESDETDEQSSETDAGDGPSTGPPADDPGTDEHPEPDGRTSVVELETVARTYALTPTSVRTDDGARVALWFDRPATDDSPARVTGWVANQNDFANMFQNEWIPGVGRTFARQPRDYAHEARLHLAPTENNELATAVPAVEQTADGHWHVEDVGPWMPDQHRLEAGERVRLEYVLVGEPGLPGRPTGTYEFRGRDEVLTVAVWETDSPGPTGESAFAGRSVPPLGAETTLQWHHDADETTRTYLEPATERRDLDGRVVFEMVNHSHEPTGCGHWNLHKLVDGEWYHVGPRIHTSDCRRLEPGGRIEWALRAFNGHAVPCDDGQSCRDGVTRGYLGGGEYAVIAGYGHGVDKSAALVELVGDPASVVPTDDAKSERDGATVRVTTDRASGDGQSVATLVLERAAEPDETAQRLLVEQVMAPSGFVGDRGGLRNLLAFASDDVDRVVLRTDERTVESAIGYDRSSRRFRFRGDTYEVTAAEKIE